MTLRRKRVKTHLLLSICEICKTPNTKFAPPVLEWTAYFEKPQFLLSRVHEPQFIFIEPPYHCTIATVVERLNSL